jgi:predicted nucleic acid-binding protein
MIERKVGLAQWRDARTKLLGLPIDIVPVDQELAEVAGEIKATKKMSLADCFAAALAKQQKGEIYTGDPEFRAIANDIKIIWLR